MGKPSINGEFSIAIFDSWVSLPAVWAPDPANFFTGQEELLSDNDFPSVSAAIPGSVALKEISVLIFRIFPWVFHNSYFSFYEIIIDTKNAPFVHDLPISIRFG